MLTNLKISSLGSKCAAAALLCGFGLTFGGATLVSAQPDVAIIETVRFSDTAIVEDQDVEVRMAVETFITAMSSADAAAVWMFASEEDQEAFESEDAVYQAFAETYPVLTQTAEINVDSIRQEGETPFVQLSLTGKDGGSYTASVGFWLDDAGDWKVVSLDVRSASDRIASL